MTAKPDNTNAPRDQDLSDFGAKTIPTQEKQQHVNAVFDSVATSYDLMNDALSLGIHRLWKDCLINLIAPQQGQNLIDLAGGTGDIAARFLKRGGQSATICDINPAMMRAGQTRPTTSQFTNKSCNRLLHWVAGDASQLPFAANSADIVAIAFGLRNVPYRRQALLEAHRVLKPSGRFFCLEFSHPRRRPISALYDLWSQLLPSMGAVIAQDAAAYRYLVESIKRFPDQETLAAMLGEAGFARVRHRDLSGGIAAIHCGWKAAS